MNTTKYPEFLLSSLKSCALKRTAPKDYSEIGEEKILKYLSISDSKSSYGYIYY